jgi:excisionase family DNA binding protein
MDEVPTSTPGGDWVSRAELQGTLHEEDYITSGEVARILRVSPKTVARWAKEGKLPHLVTLGGHRRFPAGPIHALARRLEVVDGGAGSSSPPPPPPLRTGNA